MLISHYIEDTISITLSSILSMLKHVFVALINANLSNVAGSITNILVLSQENDSINPMSSSLQGTSKKKGAQFPPLEKYANSIDEDSDKTTIVSLGGNNICMDVSYLSSQVISSYSKELQVCLY